LSILFTNLFLVAGSKGIGNRFDEQRLTLRIHRGRGSSNYHDSPHSNGSTNSTTTTLGNPSPERMSRYSTRRHEKIKISVSYPSSENISSPSAAAPPTNALYAVHYSGANGKETSMSQLFQPPEKKRGSIGARSGYLHVSDKERQQVPLSPRASKKMGKRNIKAQVKRFRMETKAAKTLAIIVGGFILCWLPFFTMYLIRPFCDSCINDVLFSVAFWIGYCNSAINPMIYALFSKDFRFAFKRIICKCFCAGPMGLAKRSSRRGSEQSQQLRASGRTPSISPSAAAHSNDGDSDPVADLSSSR
jgi:octopamine receptor